MRFLGDQGFWAINSQSSSVSTATVQYYGPDAAIAAAVNGVGGTDSVLRDQIGMPGSMFRHFKFVGPNGTHTQINSANYGAVFTDGSPALFN